MTLPVRSSVKILLVNDRKEILLMCADDPKITTADGKYHGKFWFPIGGGIEKGESIAEAALREIYEETGITKEEVNLGPIVWFGEFDLVLNGVLTRLKQQFMVAKTKKNRVTLTTLDTWETKAVKKLAWFSLEKILRCDEIIYPVLLSKYLPDILSEIYPLTPLEIDLAKQPAKKKDRS
jgi:8-oxo-dGTP pyrophosphatase MutT (NUDIX family)